MQATGVWELAWSLLVGQVQKAEFWPAAGLLTVMLLSWPAWLACRGPQNRTALRWGLGAYLLTRLMTDFVFWGPIVAGLATLFLGNKVFRGARNHAGVGGSATACILAAMCVGLTLMEPYWLVTQWAVCSLLASLVFPPILATPLDRGHTRPPWWPGLWVGLVLALSIDGLTQQIYLPLLILGTLGWGAYAFDRWRRIAKKTPDPFSWVAWGLAGVLGALTLLEVYFHWGYDASDGNTSLATSKLWWTRHVTYNGWGFRDREFDPLQRFDDHLRVVILGDSFAFGQGIVDTDHLLGPLLEAELSRRLPNDTPVTCFNLSKGGIGTDRELTIFEMAEPRIQPHAVVLVYMLNDIGEAVVFRAVSYPALNRWRRLTKASVAIDFLVWRIYTRWFMPGQGQPPLEVTYHTDSEIFARHCQTIEKLVTAVNDAGCPLVVAVYPYLDMPHDPGMQRDALDAILSVFESHNLSVIDATGLVDLTDPRFVVHRFDAHPSAELNRVLAGAIAQALMEQDPLLIPSQLDPTIPAAASPP